MEKSTNKILEGDNRSICVGKNTECFVKLILKTQELSNEIYDAIENIYGEVTTDKYYDEGFSEHFSNIFQELEKYIGISVWESVSLKENVSDTQIKI